MLSKAIPLASAEWKCGQKGQLLDISDEDLPPDTPKMVEPTSRLGDVKQSPLPSEEKEFLPPDCRGMTPCEFMGHIWDFETHTPKCEWPSFTRGIHRCIQACYDHIGKTRQSFISRAIPN